MAKLKLLTKGRHLWTRTIGSTVVGQAVDTTVVMFVAFYGVTATSAILRLIVSGYLFKVIYETIMTPATYAVVNFLKRTEGVDYFDYQTNFNPFATRGSRKVAFSGQLALFDSTIANLEAGRSRTNGITSGPQQPRAARSADL